MTKSTVQTQFNFYYFDLSKEHDAAQYAELKAGPLADIPGSTWRIEGNFKTYNKQAHEFEQTLQKLACFEHGKGLKFTTTPVLLETKHLFSDQWNSAPFDGSASGVRLFNKAEWDFANKKIKQGYYLTQTAEMSSLLRDTLKCGYCGKQYHKEHAPGEYCTACLGSEYLSKKDLPLLRLLPVASKSKRLETAVPDSLVAAWIEAQTTAKGEAAKAYFVKKREAVISAFDKQMAKATKERDVFLWLLDRGINVENVIYYDHTDTVSFGWRNGVDAEIADTFMKVAADAPFKFEIKSKRV